MKEIKIYGMIFQQITPRTNKITLSQANALCQRNKPLFLCYDRPSSTKLRTYDSWKTWSSACGSDFMNNDTPWLITDFNVHSYNPFNYTLTGVARNSETEEAYYIVVTADSRKAYKICA